MPATTTVVINPPTSTVTLVDVEVAPMGVTLCSVHASSVTPPMNWVLLDDREGDLRLLPQAAEEEAEPVEAPVPATPRRSRRRRVAEELFSRASAPEVEPAPGRPRRATGQAYRDAG